MSFLLKISFPNDEGFLEPLGEVARKAAAYVGYGDPAVRQIAAAVIDGATVALRHASGAVSPISLVFEQIDDRLEVTLTYGGEPQRSRSARADGRMDTVVYGCEGSQNVCRMARALSPDRPA